MIRADESVAPHFAAPEQLLDSDFVSERLSASLGERRSVSAARLVSHSPGKRTVIAYQTRGLEGKGSELIGKAYADPAKAERTHATLARLHAQATGAWTVAEPVALIGELGMSVQTQVSGRTIDQLHGAERALALRSTGHWLAKLHVLDLAFERRVNPDSELRKIGEWESLVAAGDPGRAADAAALAEALRARGAALRTVRVAPIHKDFHYQHVLVEGSRVAVVDVDEVRGGEPAFDVGHFCAYLRLLAMREAREGTEASQREEDAFLDGYTSASEPAAVGDEQCRFFAAYACLKIGKQLLRGKGPSPAPDEAQRAAQLVFVLDEGLRCLRA